MTIRPRLDIQMIRASVAAIAEGRGASGMSVTTATGWPGRGASVSATGAIPQRRMKLRVNAATRFRLTAYSNGVPTILQLGDAAGCLYHILD